MSDPNVNNPATEDLVDQLDEEPEVINLDIVVLGSAGCGKTSLVHRFLNDTFPPPTLPDRSISLSPAAETGAVFHDTVMTTGHAHFKVRICDTSGNDKYNSILPLYYRNSNAAIIVFDTTEGPDGPSFRRAQALVGQLRELHKPLIIALVGTKAKTLEQPLPAVDPPPPIATSPGTLIMSLEDAAAAVTAVFVEDEPTVMEARSFANMNELVFMMTSAKSGINVRRVFTALAVATRDEIVRRKLESSDEPSGHSSNEDYSKLPRTESVPSLDGTRSTAQPPNWADDSSTNHCTLCGATFSFTYRKHHCRGCGLIFCSACSSKSKAIVQFGYVKPVRVCDTCYYYGIGAGATVAKKRNNNRK